jgi:hypothetical protein
MLAFPSAFQGIKYISMFSLVVLSILELIMKNTINKNVVLSISIWLLYFLISLIVGVINGFSVDFELVSIYFITPVIALIFSTIISNNERFIYLNKMLIYITFFICVIDLFYLMNVTKLILLPFEIDSEIFGSAVLSAEKIEFRVTNQTSLMFLLPYLITIYYSKAYDSIGEKRFIFSTIIIGLVLVIFSGRRALELIVLISFILSFFLIKLKKKSKSILTPKIFYNSLKNIFGVVLLLMALFFYFFDTTNDFLDFSDAIYSTFISAFDSTTESGDIRVKQSIALYNGWIESPLFGHGINSYSKEVIRSGSTPWSYEQVYQALLYQAGILGVAMFFTYIGLIIFNLYCKAGRLGLIENKYFLGILVGFICFVIAGASNPLIYYVWIWSIVLTSYRQSIDLKIYTGGH